MDHDVQNVLSKAVQKVIFMCAINLKSKELEQTQRNPYYLDRGQFWLHASQPITYYKKMLL